MLHYLYKYYIIGLVNVYVLNRVFTLMLLLENDYFLYSTYVNNVLYLYIQFAIKKNQSENGFVYKATSIQWGSLSKVHLRLNYAVGIFHVYIS